MNHDQGGRVIVESGEGRATLFLGGPLDGCWKTLRLLPARARTLHVARNDLVPHFFPALYAERCTGDVPLELTWSVVPRFHVYRRGAAGGPFRYAGVRETLALGMTIDGEAFVLATTEEVQRAA